MNERDPPSTAIIHIPSHPGQQAYTKNGVIKLRHLCNLTAPGAVIARPSPVRGGAPGATTTSALPRGYDPLGIVESRNGPGGRVGLGKLRTRAAPRVPAKQPRRRVATPPSPTHVFCPGA